MESNKELHAKLMKLVPSNQKKMNWVLREQTHQGANDSSAPEMNVWVKGNEIHPAQFILGDLCTDDYKDNGYKLMVFLPKAI